MAKRLAGDRGCGRLDEGFMGQTWGDRRYDREGSESVLSNRERPS